MTKDELITKQQLEIEAYKIAEEKNKKLIDRINLKFIGIGQPLNDNVLGFNPKQLVWCVATLNLINDIDTNSQSK